MSISNLYPPPAQFLPHSLSLPPTAERFVSNRTGNIFVAIFLFIRRIPLAIYQRLQQLRFMQTMSMLYERLRQHFKHPIHPALVTPSPTASTQGVEPTIAISRAEFHHLSAQYEEKKMRVLNQSIPQAVGLDQMHLAIRELGDLLEEFLENQKIFEKVVACATCLSIAEQRRSLAKIRHDSALINQALRELAGLRAEYRAWQTSLQRIEEMEKETFLEKFFRFFQPLFDMDSTSLSGEEDQYPLLDKFTI